MRQLQFDNVFIRELPGDHSGLTHSRQTPGVCWAKAAPSVQGQAQLLAYSADMAQRLSLSADDVTSPAFTLAFSGMKMLPGMMPFATRYGGHQFGQWAGQLGDGRAISLGEVVTEQGGRWELQLKGAGGTPYSRRADGRAVLRSSIREFLCSEAMFHLGIPTTRALSLIATGEQVERDMFYNGNPRYEPGAVVCRVAPSFIRFGHFEILAAQSEYALLRQLLWLVINRDFPQLQGDETARFTAWFNTVCSRTAQLMVEWLRVGFVHGVMNTDNMSILGLTIDYGPYGWLEDFDPTWTPNTTDAQTRRYCFTNQPQIARWNLERLAEALLPIAPSRHILTDGLALFDSEFEQSMQLMLAKKFGLLKMQSHDEALIGAAFALMQQCEVDMTQFFQCLTQNKLDMASLALACYHPQLWLQHESAWREWLANYTARIQSEHEQDRLAVMAQTNPSFILRNYLAHQAIELAEQGDLSQMQQLLQILQTPYATNLPPQFTAMRPEWAKNQAGASMLSCSS